MPPPSVSRPGVTTSLDLVGVLHRTVHITNIADGMEEDVARLMATRAGRVDRWARGLHSTGNSAVGDMSTITMVFASLDSITTALGFNGLPLAGRKLLVWQANKDKPQELLALEYKPQASAEDAAAAAEREQRVQEILASLRADREDDVRRGKAAGDLDLSKSVMSEAEREAFLKEHAYRQAVALVVLTRQANLELQRTKDELLAEIQRTRASARGTDGKEARGVEPGARIVAAPVRFAS